MRMVGCVTLVRARSVVVALAGLAGASAMLAQRGPARGDSASLRADYRDLGELMAKLPATAAPPALDESRALWLGALPLACLDRLQPRPGRGGGRAATTTPPETSAVRGRRDSTAGDSANRNGGRGGAGQNTGAGYFWVATYSLVPDHDRLRAFWGCSDWHSSVGSTWVAARLLEKFPNTVMRELTREKLNAHLGKSNLEGEVEFFHAAAAAINPIPSASQTGLFERPYGFAWLLELQAGLRTWPDSQAQRWSANVGPLATWMADSLGAYLEKLVEPVRSGAQTNTAESMSLALDYADAAGDNKLRRSIASTARRLYLADTACATQAERVVPPAAGRGGRGVGRGAGRGADTTARSTAPNDLTTVAGRRAAPPAVGGGGPVILSPCLTEAALMSRVLDAKPFTSWLDRFLPPLQSGRFAPLTEPVALAASTSARSNGPRLTVTGSSFQAIGGGAIPDTSAAAVAAAAATEHARLTGLSFARARAMERIARALPANDPRVAAWRRLSAIQADRGYELLHDDTAGLAWLPAQALLYEMTRTP